MTKRLVQVGIAVLVAVLVVSQTTQAAVWLWGRFKVANSHALFGTDDVPLPYSFTHVWDRNSGACYVVLRDNTSGQLAMVEAPADRCR